MTKRAPGRLDGARDFELLFCAVGIITTLWFKRYFRETPFSEQYLVSLLEGRSLGDFLKTGQAVREQAL